MSRHTNGTAPSSDGVVPGDLPKSWKDLPPEIRAANQHRFRDLWPRLTGSEQALLVDVWADGWLSGWDDRHTRELATCPLISLHACGVAPGGLASSDQRSIEE